MKNIFRLFTSRIFLTTALAMLLAACDSGKGKRNPAAGQLHVTTVPEGAMVSMNGASPKSAPVTFAGLPQGVHHLIASKDGFEESRKIVRMDMNEKSAIEIKLAPVTGLLLVQTTPPGAEVEINGIHAGETPLFKTDVPIGKHRMTLSTPGFLPRTVELNVTDRRPQKITMDLRSDAARLLVESVPDAAQITYDGSAVGQTPWETDKALPGKHTVEIAMPGYEIFRAEFELNSGDERRVRGMLKAKPGALSIRSIPEGAIFFINNAPARGMSNNVLTLAPGTYEISATLKGYERSTVFQEVKPGADASVELRLVKNSGILVLTTDPTGVEIFVDGEASGITKAAQPGDTISEQLQIDLLERGRHKLQLSKKGFLDLQKNIEITPNKTLILHEKLQPRPVAFVPNVIIRAGPTEAQVFRGIIRETYDDGTIQVETSPGIFKTFTLSEIRIETIQDPYAPPPPKLNTPERPKPIAPAPAPPPNLPAPAAPPPAAPQTSTQTPSNARGAQTTSTPPNAKSTPAQFACTNLLHYNTKEIFEVAAIMHGRRRLTPGQIFTITPRIETATTPDKSVSFQCLRRSDAAAMATYVPCVALPGKPNAAGEPQLLFRNAPPEPGQTKPERIWPTAQMEAEVAFPPAFESAATPPADMRSDSGRAFFFLMDLDTGKPLSNIIELEIPLPKSRLADMLSEKP